MESLKILPDAVESTDVMSASKFYHPTVRFGRICKINKVLSRKDAESVARLIVERAKDFSDRIRDAVLHQKHGRCQSFTVDAEAAELSSYEPTPVVMLPRHTFEVDGEMFQARPHIAVCSGHHESKVWYRVACTDWRGSPDKSLADSRLIELFESALAICSEATTVMTEEYGRVLSAQIGSRRPEITADIVARVVSTSSHVAAQNLLGDALTRDLGEAIRRAQEASSCPTGVREYLQIGERRDPPSWLHKRHTGRILREGWGIVGGGQAIYHGTEYSNGRGVLEFWGLAFGNARGFSGKAPSMASSRELLTSVMQFY